MAKMTILQLGDSVNTSIFVCVLYSSNITFQSQ